MDVSKSPLHNLWKHILKGEVQLWKIGIKVGRKVGEEDTRSQDKAK